MTATLPYLATQHLLLRLRPLNRALRAAVHRQSADAKRLIRPDVTPLCVTEDQVLTLLQDMDVLVNGAGPVETLSAPAAQYPVQIDTRSPPPPERKTLSRFWIRSRSSVAESRVEQANVIEEPEPSALLGYAIESGVQPNRSVSELATLTFEESAEQETLRNLATASGIRLPLDHLAHALRLTSVEEEAVLLCAATEFDRSYERIYAYILDDLNRRHACVELLSSLTTDTVEERLGRRHALGRFGRLRRTGVLQACGDPPNELRQELRLAAGLFDYLTGGTGDLTGRFRDPAEVVQPDEIDLPPHVDAAAIERLRGALRQGGISLLGVWGPRRSGHDEVVLAIAGGAGKPLRRFVLPDSQTSIAEQQRSIDGAIHAASALGAILWIATERLSEPAGEHMALTIVDALAACDVPVILTGVSPWRPLRLIEKRAYAEIELTAPDYSAREAMWAEALPDLSEQCVAGLAARFRISGAEISTAARLARTGAALHGDGDSAALSQQIEHACTVITRQRSHQFASVIEPRRGPDDLILPPQLHAQVLEVAHFFQAWPRVAEGWGFERLRTGNGGGVKALFTGDSGTGKTLAAEVIAGALNMPLLKVDLARIVSKWVGETEQHLEAAFREAEDSNCVLFFDECDALFGKRGEVQHGVDRYANLEVSFLLQRLEDHYGLVILASNLKDNIDQAFTRRFQVVVHFPRPELAERRRIWEIAFPKDSPLDVEVDLDVFARLDMTGAGIVGAACMAGLLAADESSETITRAHVVRGIARQYQREARILTPGELGGYAAELREAK